MRIRTITFLFIVFLLSSSLTVDVIASGCVPACTGECKTCQDGVCVDDDDLCDGCETCTSGTCDYECLIDYCCYNDGCWSDCPTGWCCEDGQCVSSCPSGKCCDDGECVSSCPSGKCCDDGDCVDDCPTGQCCDDGDCEPMEMDYVTSDKASACVECDITFTATTDPTGYEDDVEWSGGGDPSTGSGATFTTHWDTSGTKTVTAELCDSDESKEVTIVKVDKVVKSGTTDEGPIYVCPDDTVDLEAKPAPEDTSFPSGEPQWSIESQPSGASASLSPSSGSATTTLSGITKKGNYVIKAQCGDSDTGDTIVVKMASSGYWDSWVPGFGCPCSLLIGCGDCDAGAPDSPDDCGNTLTITCNNSSGNCCFQYWYNSTEVGRCVWVGGRNVFEYKITANGELFLKTDIHNCNDKRGVDSDGEGCDGYFCWRRVTFDCIDTSATPQVKWRKEDLDQCPCGPGSKPGIGEACLGEDGVHPGHPN